MNLVQPLQPNLIHLNLAQNCRNPAHSSTLYLCAIIWAILIQPLSSPLTSYIVIIASLRSPVSSLMIFRYKFYVRLSYSLSMLRAPSSRYFLFNYPHNIKWRVKVMIYFNRRHSVVLHYNKTAPAKNTTVVQYMILVSYSGNMLRSFFRSSSGQRT